EIDLDAEVGPPKPPSGKTKGGPPVKPASGKTPRKAAPDKPAAEKPAAPQLPKDSPFELSEADLDVDKPAKPKRPEKRTQHKPVDDDSSDIELTPGPSSSPLELDSDELAALPADDEEVELGHLSDDPGGSSGINLRDPADSGISLEQEGSDEFELSLDDSGE